MSDDKKREPKKIKKSQLDTNQIGQKGNKPLTLSEAHKLMSKHGLELKEEEKGKRIYRKRDELPDPDVDARASVNRLAKQLSPRVYQEHVDLFNECAKGFPSKRHALERAIELLAIDTGIEPK